MKRIMIVGTPGAGKTTLARRLGQILDLPVFHMDHIHWKSGWIERAPDEKTRLTHEVHMRDTWIFEGGHSRSFPERVARADTFIWLDLPVWRRTYRVLRRSWMYRGRTRPDLPEGCPEQFNRQTLEFLGFIWRTRRSSWAKLQAIYANPPPHLAVHHLTTVSAIDAFVESCAGGRWREPRQT